MTGSIALTSAANKDTSTIQSESGSGSSGGPNLPGPAPLTTEEKKTENLARVARNLLLQQRRDAQETNVPADEPLLHIISRPSTPTPMLPPTPFSSANNCVGLLSAFSQFSPGSQKKVQTLINSSLPLPTNALPDSVPKLLFSIERERPSSSTSHTQSFGIHPFILNLGHNGVHIPLSLFTTSTTNKLHNHATSIKQNIIYNSSGTKCHLMDLTQFQAESDMDVADWHEAWNCYNLFLRTHADKAVAQHAHVIPFLPKRTTRMHTSDALRRSNWKNSELRL
ncbi:hypothetical protein SCP_0213380 [Sparassis crispa]|uniref:Uncharacterized protein n=1 Tax=Sparassis crispa TaxID=139825 RepID=A0A401GDC1_9APHY|nr:hypothetical protein SCP_0213380 [Sparassis crispa]GBE80135.1 hypothetical protein SCP_0213380 [Sparassis crispa]